MNHNDIPFKILNETSQKAVIILCDHAGDIFPDGDNFGLTPDQLKSDVVCDWGTEEVAKRLADEFGFFTIISRYSRLLCDLNRYPNSDNVMDSVSQRGFPVPGNQSLSFQDKAERINTYFWPYHDAITQKIEALKKSGFDAVSVISIHSFAPEYHGVQRPWELGVLCGDDKRMATPFIETMQKYKDIQLGINEPYSVNDVLGYGFSVSYHAVYRYYPHIMLEIRQNELETEEQINKMTNMIIDGLRSSINSVL